MIQVIEGGLKPEAVQPEEEITEDLYQFVAGEVSNTRLMGVICMHAAYLNVTRVQAYHFFMYFDYEDLGLDHIKTLIDVPSKELGDALGEAFGGLGAQLMDINDREAAYLMQYMVRRTIDMKKELPANLDDIKFVLADEIILSPEEQAELDAKLCVEIKTDYGVVNYYLMRSFGKDNDGAAILVGGDDIEEIAPKSHSTFLINKITPTSDEDDDVKTYRCESLIDVDGDAKHHHVVSEIDVKDKKVVAAHKIADFPISLYEAGLQLNKHEFITVYELKEDADIEKFAKDFSEFSLGMTRNEHSSGDMFMEFNLDNNHVESDVFRLNDDIKAAYFISHEGQLIAVTYSLDAIVDCETRIVCDPIAEHLTLTNRYTFGASVLYDYAESGYTDFNEFLSTLD